MTTTSQALSKARTRIESQGWVQGMPQHPRSGRVCSVGALQLEVESRITYIEALRYLVLATTTFTPKQLDAISSDGQRSLVERWNDDEQRRLTDVLDAFIHAEKLALEDEAQAQ